MDKPIIQGTLWGPPITYQVHIFHLIKSIFHSYTRNHGNKENSTIGTANQFDVSQPSPTEKRNLDNTALLQLAAPQASPVCFHHWVYFYHSYFSYYFTITCMPCTVLIVWVMHSKQNSFKLQYLWINFIWDSWFFRGIKSCQKASPCWRILVGCFSVNAHWEETSPC